MAAQVLMNLNLKLEEVREEVLNLLGHGIEGSEGGERNPAGGAGGGGGSGASEGGKSTRARNRAGTFEARSKTTSCRRARSIGAQRRGAARHDEPLGMDFRPPVSGKIERAP